MSEITWGSYTLAELLRAVDNGQDVPISALALAARSVLDELDDANNTIRTLEDEEHDYRAALNRTHDTLAAIRALLEKLEEELP